MVDRIADIWGTRTPHARDGLWPVRVDQALDGGADGGRRRPVGAVGVRAVQQRLRLRHRGQGRPRWSGVRGRAGDVVNHGRLGPEGPVRQLAWASHAGPADPAAGPRGRPAGGDRLGHRDGPDRRAQQATCWTRTGPLSHGFYTSGQLFLEEYYTLAVIGKAGHRHPAHGRQHPAVHRDRGGGVEGVLRRRRPARLLHRHRALRRDLPLRPQHGRDPDGAVVADPGPHSRAPTRRRSSASTRATPRSPRGRAHRRCPPRRPAGHQPGPDERPGPRAVRQRLGRRGLGRRAHPRPRRAPGDRRAVHARGGRPRSAASTPTDVRRAAADLRRRASGCCPPCCRASTSRTRPRPRPCQVNNLHLLRGHDRPARLRDPADERPAHRAEQPRVRRRRRPAGLPQLGQPGPRRSELADAVERRPDDDPALGAADPRHADLPLRRAGLDRVPVDLGHQPGRVHARVCRGSGESSPGPSCFLVVQDLFLTETAQLADVVLPGGRLGREDRDVHQRQPHRPPVRARPSSRPGRPAATSTSSSTYARRMGFTDQRRRTRC